MHNKSLFNEAVSWIVDNNVSEWAAETVMLIGMVSSLFEVDEAFVREAISRKINNIKMKFDSAPSNIPEFPSAKLAVDYSTKTRTRTRLVCSTIEEANSARCVLINMCLGVVSKGYTETGNIFVKAGDRWEVEVTVGRPPIQMMGRPYK